MIPQRIDPNATLEELCQLSGKWRISWVLASRLVGLAIILPFPISIISGWRTEEEQAALERAGRPTAAPGVSTHTSCPLATGADLSVQVAVTDVVKATLGEAAFRAGLRWGGGSPVDAGGIPTDWNHVDLGPRQRENGAAAK